MHPNASALLETLSNRHNPGIDPVVHIWGWEVPGYLFLGGLVAGIMVLLSAMELTGRKPESKAAQAMPFAAVALLSLGMFLLFLDLAHPLHVLRFYASFQPTSPMSWGSWLLLVVYPVLLLLGLGGLAEAQRARWVRVRGRAGRAAAALVHLADRLRRPVLIASFSLGVGLGIYTGLLLGTMVARPAWSSGVLGALFLISGLSTGAAFMLLGRLEHREAKWLLRSDTAAIVVELGLLAILMLSYQTAGAAGQASGALFMGGRYTAPFWGLVVALGLVVPLAMNVLELRRGLPATRFTPLLVLIGGFALRSVLVAAGQALSYGDFG